MCCVSVPETTALRHCEPRLRGVFVALIYVIATPFDLLSPLVIASRACAAWQSMADALIAG